MKLWYYNNKKLGEIDLMTEMGERVLPIEIKSGKDYKRHSALSNILSVDNYHIPEAIVFSNSNVSQEGKILYLPIYMLFCLKPEKMPDPVYHPDLTGLMK